MRSLEIGDGLTVPAHLLRAVTSRSGGPGGQAVNKLETRVTVELDVDAIPGLDEEQRERVRERLRTRINKEGVLRVTSQAARSQLENRDTALARMESLLQDALTEQAARKPTRVSRRKREERLREKQKQAQKKRDRRAMERE